MVLGRSLNIRDVCTDFKPCFKVHNLVSVHPKSIKLGQMTTRNVIFHVVVSVLETRISSCTISEWPVGQKRPK